MDLLKVFAVKDIKGTNYFKDRLLDIKINNDGFKKISNIISNQFFNFRKFDEEIDFSKECSFSLEKKQVFFVCNEEYLNNISDLFDNNINFNPFKIELMQENMIKSFAYLVEEDNNKYILFQQFRKNHLYKNKNIPIITKLIENTIGISGEEYTTFEQPLIIFPDFIVGYYDLQSKKLYFRYSQSITSTVDVSIYYKEATSKEIENDFLGGNSLFVADDYQFVIDNTTINDKKKIFAIISNLENIKKIGVDLIIAEAEKVGIYMSLDEQNKIIIPENKKELQKYLKFFNADLYHNPLFDKIFESNSKKEVKYSKK
ncbi:hypothetical protein [Brachyspira hyodysenteriae]|uniref:hypothetical protein n=1 Tax=Brachyspira hyodysenteriae TaxID=159 RepID=UPI00063D9C80|nr:hypothetical protein [Brachyspira hyodysenteriae]KLI25732.1 hypothetical protein SU43_03575 [Brachyspira hyodysenteriae]TVL82379.1 hypothetical protein A9X82_12715 [Brachyspira hyodysenteriae]